MILENTMLQLEITLFPEFSLQKTALYTIQLWNFTRSIGEFAACTGTMVVLFNNIHTESHFVITYLPE
jgi:hypothetical protein